MAATIILILILLSFAFIAVFSAKERVDIMAWSLFLGIFVSILTSLLLKIPLDTFWDTIPFKTIVYLIFFDVFVHLLNQEHLFEYFAIQIIHYTKSNVRLFFYTISLVSALLSGVMMDISVALIFLPIIYRATHILKIESRPFVLGVAFSISIGNLLSPFSMAVNIVIASEANLSFSWFFKNLFVFFVLIEAMTLIVIDFVFLKQQEPPSPVAKRILLDIMDPELLIVNKWRFIRHVAYFVILIILLFLNFMAYLMVVMCVLLICLFEQKKLGTPFKKVGWALPFLLMGIFLLIGNLEIIGVITDLERIISQLMGEQFILTSILVLIFSAFIGSFISKNLSAVIFLSIFATLLKDTFILPAHFNILYIALIIGINLGGNMIPQASSHVLYTLDFVKKNKILHLDFNSYTKFTMISSGIYTLLGIIYILANYLIQIIL